ncbi:hypothetical protein [Wenjunlia vitaminophila]|uniref:hypothetical protein n=1 Tax=Wenjunlia vitaminophila TaxID=76728 RepID=UPI00036C595E|nr:hypothetical protein [Wenjunlia vitaminophila]
MDYQLTITTPGRPPAVRTVTGDTPAVHPHARGILRHGYALADLDRIARAACAADRSLAADMSTRYDIAWSAVALALAEAAEPPSWQHLVRVGWQAIYAEVRDVRRLYGIPRDRAVDGVASAPRFTIYWHPTSGTAAEDVLVETVAVRQILATLSPIYRNAVVALAAHDTVRAAAQALGISEVAMKGRLRTAKAQFAERWFAPDPAPRLRRDRRVGAYDRALATHCSAGHEWTPETTRWGRGRPGGARVRRCRACERERGAARRAAATGIAA